MRGIGPFKTGSGVREVQKNQHTGQSEVSLDGVGRTTVVATAHAGSAGQKADTQISKDQAKMTRKKKKAKRPAATVAPVICPYCSKQAKWVDNEVIYGKRYGASWKAYYCEPCDAYVGCHENTRIPKGTLANKETRTWRIKAHAAFDPLWKQGHVPRGKLYAEIASDLGRQVHIGEADPAQCQEIIAWCRQYRERSA